MPGGNGVSDRFQADELVTQADERHVPCPAAELHVVEDPLEERDRGVEVADLDREMVDPDESGHEARLAMSGV